MTFAEIDSAANGAVVLRVSRLDVPPQVEKVVLSPLCGVGDNLVEDVGQFLVLFKYGGCTGSDIVKVLV